MRVIFKDIKGFEGLYAVSNLGNVKRHTTEAKNGTGNYYRKEHLLKQRKNNKGYFSVDLYKNNVRHQCLVHRLVAEQFIGNPNNYPCVNHKDENNVFVAPVTEGDSVYIILLGHILPFDVISVSLFRKTLIFKAQHGLNLTWVFKMEDFGKTVFLTREEAEKALKESEQK